MADGERTLNETLNTLQEHAVNIAVAYERLTALKSALEGITKLLFTGDGKQPLITQLSELGQDIQGLKGDIAVLTSGLGSMRESITSLKKDQDELESIRESNKNAMKIAIISSITSLLVALIGGAILYYTRK